MKYLQWVEKLKEEKSIYSIKDGIKFSIPFLYNYFSYELWEISYFTVLKASDPKHVCQKDNINRSTIEKTFNEIRMASKRNEPYC